MYRVTPRHQPRHDAKATCNACHADTSQVKTFVRSSALVASRHYIGLAAIACLCFWPTQPVLAGITKCTLADGSVVFQDKACEVTPKTKGKAASVTDAVPLGIEQSWFDQPPAAPYQAACTTSGCDCGKYSREFKHGLPMAVADALYIDGSWHRLDATLDKLALTSENNNEFHELREESQEAACNILMSQITLRKYGKRVLSNLRSRKRYAEDMGLDDPEDCDAGNFSACEYTDDITLYNRIISDVKALVETERNSLGGQEFPERSVAGRTDSKLTEQSPTKQRTNANANADFKRKAPTVSAAHGTKAAVR